MATAGNPGMERLILLMNKIQDVCTRMGTQLQLNLPQIAVIGSQSAGKSSVLEGFVGRDFLPRGNGIVTRCPLVLQLINTPGDEEYSVFLRCKDKKFTNFNEIRTEIENETNRIAGDNKGISSIPINLRIYSPNVLNLTLVDLPGITKVPIGDEPLNIEMIVRNLIIEYIREENCLILAVSEANVDLATSEALKLAKEVDKNGSRTIGVLTKLDLMDDGTNARKMLENKIIPLRLGYIGVVNRSQRSIDDKKDIANALKDERAFFMQNDCYSDFVDRSGIPYLQKMLNKTLAEHICDKLPGLRDTVLKRTATLKKKIDDYEQSHPTDPDTIKQVILTAMHKLQLNFQSELGSLGADDLILTDRISSGGKIRRIFHERLPLEIDRIKVDGKELRHKMNCAIDTLYGKNPIMDFPFKAFEIIVRQRIPLLKKPIEQCVDLVIEELTKAVKFCTQRIVDYPAFRTKIENAVLSFIHSKSATYKENVLVWIDIQSAYMNTKHEDFQKVLSAHSNRKQENESIPSQTGFPFGVNVPVASGAIPFKFSLNPNASNSDNDLVPSEKDLDYHFKKVMSYMRIVEKSTADMVPKVITYYIIKDVEKFIAVDLSVKIVDNFGTNITELTAGDPVSNEQYEENKEMCNSLEKILEEIDQIGNL